MASLADSAVTVQDSWEGGGVNARRFAYRRVVLVLTGQGGTTNLISAGNLRLKSVEGSTPLVKSDDSVVLIGAANYAGTALSLCATASDAPADATGTFKCTVWGIS